MSAETGKRIHAVLLVLWVVVGLPLSYVLRESIAWLVFLSVYAIVAAHASGISAERPTDDSEKRSLLP